MKARNQSAPGEIDQDPVRARAAWKTKQRRQLQAHVLSYVLVNALQVGLWWALTPDVFFWPLISLAGWGIGLAFHIWAVATSEAEVEPTN